MNDDSDPSRPNLGPAAQRAKEERDARRAAALRANLRRRKAQERGRDEDSQAQASLSQPSENDAPPHNLFPRISD